MKSEEQKKKQKQTPTKGRQILQTLAAMLTLFVVVAGISLIVMILGDKLGRDGRTEQTTDADIQEMIPNMDYTYVRPDSTTAQIGGMFSETETTGTKLTTASETNTTTSTSPTHATQAPPVTAQKVTVIYNSALYAKLTSTTRRVTSDDEGQTAASGGSTTTTTTTVQQHPQQAAYDAFAGRLRDYMQSGTDSSPMYSLVPLFGEDAAPLLVISGGREVDSPAYVYAYVNGSAHELKSAEGEYFGNLQFAEEEQCLIEIVWREGVKYTYYYDPDNGELKLRHSFSYDGTENGYVCDGEHISAEAYMEYMHHDKTPVDAGREYSFPASSDALTSVGGVPVSH